MNDPFELDRWVASAARDLRLERVRFRTLEGVQEGAASIPRRISSQAALDELLEQQERGASLLVAALIEWVRHLAVARVTARDRAEVFAARFGEHGAFSEIVQSLLQPSANTPAIERKLCDAAAGVHDALRRREERVREASRLIGLQAGAAAPAAPAFAEQVLAITDAAFMRDDSPSWSAPLKRSLAIDAAEGWPVHLTHRWLASLFAGGELVRGVKLEDVPLPIPLGAASFSRALGFFGDMLAFADRPNGSPFCLVRAPHDRLVARRSCLFAGLPLEPTFFQKKLGLGKSFAVEQTRFVARSAVIWLRVAALRVLACPLLQSDRGGRDFEELSERVLGRALPGVLLGVLPAFGPSDGVLLESAADACLERARLRERFDDDWFENPRAHEALRHEHQLPIADRPPLWAPPPEGEAIPCAAKTAGEPAEFTASSARAAALSARLAEALDE